MKVKTMSEAAQAKASLLSFSACILLPIKNKTFTALSFFFVKFRVNRP